MDDYQVPYQGMRMECVFYTCIPIQVFMSDLLFSSFGKLDHHLILPFMYDAVASLLFVFSASVGLFLMVIRSSVWQNGVDSISVYNSRGHASE